MKKLLLLAGIFFLFLGSSSVKSPLTGADVFGGNCTGDNSWGSFGNVLAQDSSYSNCFLPGFNSSECLKSTNYTNAIPAGSTIDSVTAFIRYKQSASGIVVQHIYLVVGGSVTGNDMS